MTDQTRTPEEIEELKTNWAKDPCWDIENEEGFEAHRDELLAFRLEKQKEWQEKRDARDDKRAEKVMLATGLGMSDRETLLALHTFEEIEWDATMRAEDAQTHLMLCQVRATLLQATQLKRIADALERMESGNDTVNTVDDEALRSFISGPARKG